MAYKEHHAAEVIASGAINATGNSADMTNENARGALVIVDISAVSGTSPTLTVKLQAKDPISGHYADIPGATTTALNATGTTLLVVYPGAAVTANSSVSQPLPRTWRVAYTLGGSASPTVTASVSVQYVL